MSLHIKKAEALAALKKAVEAHGTKREWEVEHRNELAKYNAVDKHGIFVHVRDTMANINEYIGNVCPAIDAAIATGDYSAESETYLRKCKADFEAADAELPDPLQEFV